MNWLKKWRKPTLEKKLETAQRDLADAEQALDYAELQHELTLRRFARLKAQLSELGIEIIDPVPVVTPSWPDTRPE